MLKKLIFIHGRPACGKDIQSDLIMAQTPNSSKISGVYRSAFTRTGDYAQYHDQVAPFIKPLGKGIDIPGHTVANILEEIVETSASEGKNLFLICGLLRTIDHKKAIEAQFGQKDETIIKHIYLSIPESVSINHAQLRMIEGRKNGNERPDDQVMLMRSRLDRYRSNTIPMLKMLSDEGNLKIIRADRPIEDINRDIKSYLFGEIGLGEGQHRRVRELM